MDKQWIGVDRGGTFTDVVAISDDGTTSVVKLLSTSTHYNNAITAGIKRMRSQTFDAQVQSIKIGTTIATNALLEKKGEDVCFVTTAGFEECLEIGYQDRSEIFALKIDKKKPLYKKVIAIDERIDASGKVLMEIDEEKVRSQLQIIYNDGIRSLAITLQHSWRNFCHEKIIEKVAHSIGFTYIFCSYCLAPVIKYVMRSQTTILNAYLHPLVQRYMNVLISAIPDIPIYFMQSNGGITSYENFCGKDAILSGPAGGIVAVQHIAQTLGCDKAISFDMGGTSTDVARFCGSPEKIFETQIDSIPFHSDMLKIHTIAAGGGSILKYDGIKMMVGPESAGAQPGPCCYGLGGPLTITDANLFLGRLVAQYFPKVFGESGQESLNEQEVRKKFTTLANEINNKAEYNLSVEEIASGFIRIANENMSNAIKQISIAEGFSFDKHILVCFGGAGAQHACALSRLLDIPQIVIHPLSGVLSAYGIALAQGVKTSVKSVLLPFNEKTLDDLQSSFAKLETEVLYSFSQQNLLKKIFRYIDLRITGTDTNHTILVTNFQDIHQKFASEYQKQYGIQIPSKKLLEIVNIRIEVMETHHKFQEKSFPVIKKEVGKDIALTLEHSIYFDGKRQNVPVFQRTNITPGSYLFGPAIIVEDNATVFVEPNFKVSVNEYNHLILDLQKNQKQKISTEKDPVLLEIFNNSFMHIARQMGFTLINTAHSTNIKERLDFSCAVFDKIGNLVANAPHIPVHLGAMSETVKALLEDSHILLNPGDTYVSNDPFHGGSHLPDITVITPFFDETNNIEFVVACRGHHADIGGITPGSMPPFSTNIEEEGVLIHNVHLVKDNILQQQKICEVLSSGKYPARNINERLSDLQAQIAANYRGIKELKSLIAQYGNNVVHAYTQYVRENACTATENVIHNLLKENQKQQYKFQDFLESGAIIKVNITLYQQYNSYKATIDFTGTSPEDKGNLNAPQAVVKAAILYVFRTLMDDNIPLNSGCFDPINIIIPQKSILSPTPGKAVVGGNVETSQRIVDVLYGALQIVAASQGTMNNFTFGKDGEDGFGYYETICGGSGAGFFFNGTSAVHTHMTNTRITDPEILEYRYPQVQLQKFAIRHNSGGQGKYKGGNGVIRQLLFRKECQVSILSERRSTPPYGLAGGENAQCGKNTITYTNGTEQTLPAKVSLAIKPGETITIYTPGGGGYGGV